MTFELWLQRMNGDELKMLLEINETAANDLEKEFFLAKHAGVLADYYILRCRQEGLVAARSSVQEFLTEVEF